MAAKKQEAEETWNQCGTLYNLLTQIAQKHPLGDIPLLLPDETEVASICMIYTAEGSIAAIQLSGEK